VEDLFELKPDATPEERDAFNSTALCSKSTKLVRGAVRSLAALAVTVLIWLPSSQVFGAGYNVLPFPIHIDGKGTSEDHALVRRAIEDAKYGIEQARAFCFIFQIAPDSVPITRENDETPVGKICGQVPVLGEVNNWRDANQRKLLSEYNGFKRYLKCGASAPVHDTSGALNMFGAFDCDPCQSRLIKGNPWPLFGQRSAFGDSIGLPGLSNRVTGVERASNSRLGGFHGFGQRLANVVDADAGYQNASASSAKNGESPKGHILLGLQILIGGLVAVMGFKLIRHAFGKGGDINPDAGLGYFLAGVAAILLGIFLISGISLMYLGVLF